MVHIRIKLSVIIDRDQLWFDIWHMSFVLYIRSNINDVMDCGFWISEEVDFELNIFYWHIAVSYFP